MYDVTKIKKYLQEVGNITITTVDDITREEWQDLDSDMEYYDRMNIPYNLDEMPLLKFVLNCCYKSKAELFKVPNFISMGEQFKLWILLYQEIMCVENYGSDKLSETTIMLIETFKNK